MTSNTSVGTRMVKTSWRLWKQTTLTVRESRRFKTKRKKLDWTRTKFFCLPSLLPRQRNKDLQAQSASTLAVQTPHTVCTVHSHNLFFFLPPWLQVKIVDLSCCSWRISTRPRGVWENYPTLPQKHNFTLSDFPPFAFTHLFFRGLVPPTNNQSLAYLTTRTYLSHRGLMWSYSPKDGVQTKS